MKIYHIDRDISTAVHAHGSHDVTLSWVANLAMYAHFGVMYLAPGGVVGYHQAANEQLFMIVDGKGWVTGVDRRHINIENGQAVFWQEREWHESGTDVGMTAIIIEAKEIQPLLPEILRDSG